MTESPAVKSCRSKSVCPTSGLPMNDRLGLHLPFAEVMHSGRHRGGEPHGDALALAGGVEQDLAGQAPCRR